MLKLYNLIIKFHLYFDTKLFSISIKNYIIKKKNSYVDNFYSKKIKCNHKSNVLQTIYQFIYVIYK